MVLIFLSSGLFLGWSLGANDAANVFGSAVGTRMVRFKTAALICGIFVILGAVIGGGGTSHTLGVLGSVNAIGGAFTVALAAGFTVFWMTRLQIPVSTSQAIVGAIIGWNIFSGSPTDAGALQKIVSTWILCPVLAAILAVILYKTFGFTFNHLRLHLLRRDMYLRVALIAVGAFGAYSLGSNNIANVMGVFVPVRPFEDVVIFNSFSLTGTEQLFLLGGIAIAIGVYTYSRKVMETVGGSLLKLSPEAALVVVLAQALVLFFFASEELEYFLISNGLPSFPLVPVSSSQAIIGAIIGIGLLRSWRSLKFRVLGNIAVGWIITPIAAGIFTFVSLFFMQNVFNQEVQKDIEFSIGKETIQHLEKMNIRDAGLEEFVGKTFFNNTRFRANLEKNTKLDSESLSKVMTVARKDSLFIDPVILSRDIDREWFTAGQINVLRQLESTGYRHTWQLLEMLEAQSEEWQLRPDLPINKLYNKDLKSKREFVLRVFLVQKE